MNGLEFQFRGTSLHLTLHEFSSSSLPKVRLDRHLSGSACAEQTKSVQSTPSPHSLSSKAGWHSRVAISQEHKQSGCLVLQHGWPHASSCILRVLVRSTSLLNIFARGLTLTPNPNPNPYSFPSCTCTRHSSCPKKP
jgi:hypothetical protein